MAKAPVSPKFQKFASSTTRGEYDKARKAESMLSGCPLPIGTRGVALVGEITCTETKTKADGTGGDPFVSIHLEVESPEEYRGKILQGPGLMFVIKDGPKSTAADAWGRMLDTLEAYGLPREIRTEYQDFSEVLDWFEAAPRRVEYNVQEDTFTGNSSGKTVRAVAYVAEGDVPTAETKQAETSATDPDGDYCEFLGKKYKILDFDKDNKTYNLEMVGTGRIRNGIPADKVTLLD